MDITSFKDQHVLVVGDIILEKYWFGQSSRISPEAPVPVVRYNNSEYKLAGSANLVNNIKSLGAKVSFVSLVVSTDKQMKEKSYQQVISEINKQKIENLTLLPYLEKTSEYVRVFAQDHQLINIDNNKKQYLNNTQKKKFLEAIEQILKEDESINKVIISDYGLGAIFDIQGIIALSKEYNKEILIDPFINPKKSNLSYISTCQGADFLVLNKNQIDQIELEQEDAIGFISNNLLTKALLVTAGKQGMKLFFNANYYDKPVIEQKALSNELSDISGIGDVVAASFILSSDINEYQETLRLANAACGSAVRKMGVSIVNIIEAQLGYADLYYDYAFNFLKQLQNIRAKKKDSKKIVFTNGCFDLFHIGHLTYLKKAKNEGDILVIGVNSDASIRKLKGDSRPVNDLKSRINVLEELDFVDYVLPFYEDTPCNLIESIKPDILVKGTDYKESEIVGADIVKKYGGKVAIISHNHENISSSKIIEQIS